MPRSLRINCPDIPYHIIVRGNNREPIFLDRSCYERFLNLLSGYKPVYEYKIYAYCLMPNHLHLLLESSSKATISKIMQVLNTSYTVYFNNRYGRVGHVIQGRFKSILVEREAYLLVLSRYIHLNPIRAKIVERPEDYCWSSYRIYLGRGKSDLLSKEEILGFLTDESNEQVELYKNFVEEGIKESASSLVELTLSKHQTFLGSDRFVQDVCKTLRS